MKEYVLARTFRTYLKICWKYKIICPWIRNMNKLKGKDRFMVYTLYHKYHHDIFRFQKKNYYK